MTGGKTNAARRIYEIFSVALQAQPLQGGSGHLTVSMWARSLGGDYLPAGFDPQNLHDNEDIALPLLAELRQQIRSVDRSQREGPDYSRLVAPLISGAMNVTATNILNQNWTDVRNQQLTPQLVSGWGLLAGWLPNTDPTIGAEDLAALVEAINALEAAAVNPDVPEPLRHFAFLQVAAFRTALLRYSVSGITSVREALASAIGVAQREQSELAEVAEAEPAKSKAVMQAFFRLLGTGAKVADDVEKYAKAFTIGYDAAVASAPIVTHLLSYLKP